MNFISVNIQMLLSLLHPDKAIVSWKYCKSRTHLLHRNYRTSQLSLTYLKHAQKTCINLQLSNYFEFHRKSNCLLLLFTGSRKHRWTFYRHDGMWKSKTENPKYPGNTLCCRLLIVYNLVIMCRWFTAAAQLQERVSDHMGKKSKCKIQSNECAVLLHHCKSNIHTC